MTGKVSPEPAIAPSLPSIRRLRRAALLARSAHVQGDVEAEINCLLAEFQGNPRAAIRALLHDLDMIVADYEASISKGYLRGVGEA